MRGLLAMLLVIGCSSPTPAPTQSTGTTADPTTTAPAAAGPRIVLPDGFVLNVEVVADDESRAQGLMYRDRLAADRGMLFVFPQDDVFSFWMKNTRIPLDMIWIDANRRIVGLIPNVPPCHVPNCPSYGPGVLARYVLEIAGGEAAKHGLKVGDSLQFIDTDVEAR